jgi:hypothetical protein
LIDYRVDRRAVLAQLVIGCLAAAVPASAQTVFKATPSVSMSQQYDSNLFSAASTPEADFFTRVSPSIDSIWNSELWTLTARYLQDIERFDQHPALSSITARQQAALTAGYHQSRRVGWTGNVEFWKTQTPGELNETNGLTLGRATARRLAAQVSMLRRANAATSQKLEYAATHDQLAGGTGATTHDVVAGIERHRSLRTMIRMDYRFREFLFDLPGEQTSQVAAHTLTIGLTRALSPRTLVAIDAGPRFTTTSSNADVRASVSYQSKAGQLSVMYARSQTTVIGLTGVAETQGVSAAAEWPIWSSLRVRIAPGLFQSDMAGTHVTAAVFGVTLTRPVAHDLAVDVDFNGNFQHGAISSLARPSIARQVVAIRLVAGSTPSSR